MLGIYDRTLDVKKMAYLYLDDCYQTHSLETNLINSREVLKGIETGYMDCVIVHL